MSMFLLPRFPLAFNLTKALRHNNSVSKAQINEFKFVYYSIQNFAKSS